MSSGRALSGITCAGLAENASLCLVSRAAPFPPTRPGRLLGDTPKPPASGGMWRGFGASDDGAPLFPSTPFD